MQPDPNAAINFSYDSQVGASTLSVPEFDTGQVGSFWECYTLSPKVIKFKLNLGVELLVTHNCRGPENGSGCTPGKAKMRNEAPSSVTAKGGDAA